MTILISVQLPRISRVLRLYDSRIATLKSSRQVRLTILSRIRTPQETYVSKYFNRCISHELQG